MTVNRDLLVIADDASGVIPSHKLAEGPKAPPPASFSETIPATRRHLPDERRAITHHFSIAGQEGYITVGVYEDGSPGEMFVRMAKEGSTVSGLMDAFATVVSLALQHGVPLSVICGKLSHMRFEPSGWSGNPSIGYAKSLMDYIARWLELKFLNGEQGQLFPPLGSSEDDTIAGL